MKRLMATVVLLASATATSAEPPENLAVLPSEIDGIEPRVMMQHYLAAHTRAALNRWRTTYEGLETLEQISSYQKQRRALFLKHIGGLPQRTPLNARVTGTLQRSGYRIEKILFESQPKHFVPCNLYLPDEKKYPRPIPGVVVVCGHAKEAKAYDAYARVATLCALHGLAALVIDPIEQGERIQWLDDEGRERIRWGTYGHTIIGISAALLGQNTARFEIWDTMRGIDYLQSRPEVSGAPIGLTGSSGGGTQTSQVMALDDRVRVAVPSCYLTSLERLLSTIGPQDSEQNIYGQLDWGMDHADYLLMRAPRPTLIAANTEDFFEIGGTWDTFRYAKRFYTRLNASHCIDLVEIDAQHGYQKPAREAAVRFLVQFLYERLILDPIAEPGAMQVPDERELWATPAGQVMRLPDARSVYDLMVEDLALQAASRPELTPDLVRRTAGFPSLDATPVVDIDEVGRVKRDGDYTITKLIFRPRENAVRARLRLPALLFVPSDTRATSGQSGGGTRSRRGVLYVHALGKTHDADVGGPIEKLVRQGQVVLAVDVRGTGETFDPRRKFYHIDFGGSGKEYMTAYLLGRSYVGMRAADLLVAAKWLRDHAATDGEQVNLVAIGHLGVPALHVAVAEPGLFDRVRTERTLDSWATLIQQRAHKHQLVNLVHGVLAAYDLPDLRSALGDRLTVVEPLDALGHEIR